MLTLKVPSLWGRRFKNSESFTTTVAVLLKTGLVTKEDVKKKLGVNVTDAFMKRCTAEDEIAKSEVTKGETAEDEDEDEVAEDEEDTDAIQKAVGDVHGQRSAGTQAAGANSGAAGRGSVGKTASAAARTAQAASQPTKSR